MTLRGQLIRLAYQRPKLRNDLIPLLEEGTSSPSRVAAVGLSPQVLMDLAPDVSITPDLLRAGTKWTAAVARALSAWKQRAPDLSMGELMKEAPDAVLHLFQGDDWEFQQWVVSTLNPSLIRPLSKYLLSALQRDYDRLLSATR